MRNVQHLQMRNHLVINASRLLFTLLSFSHCLFREFSQKPVLTVATMMMRVVNYFTLIVINCPHHHCQQHQNLHHHLLPLALSSCLSEVFWEKEMFIYPVQSHQPKTSTSQKVKTVDDDDSDNISYWSLMVTLRLTRSHTPSDFQTSWVFSLPK